MKQLRMKQTDKNMDFWGYISCQNVTGGTLAASIIGNALTERGIIRAGEGANEAGENFQFGVIL